MGWGGFLNGAYFSISWDNLRTASMALPAASQKYNKPKLWPKRTENAMWVIHYRELFAHWWAFLLWGPTHLANTSAVLHGDNAIARHDLNKMRSPNVVMMRLIRHICVYNAAINARVRVHEISSGENLLVDALSRLDMVTYHTAYTEWKTTVRAPTTAPGSGVTPMYQPRVFSNPGLMEHRVRIDSRTDGVAVT